MRAGCDAITEKPMTVDERKCQQILDAIEETGKSLRVTFNYRYAPRASKVVQSLSLSLSLSLYRAPLSCARPGSRSRSDFTFR